MSNRTRYFSSSARLLMATVLLAFGVAAPSLAQVPRIYDFLRFDASARSAAMGGTFMTISGDPAAMHYNPATLNTIDTTQLQFTFFKHLLDINSGSAQGATEIDGLGKVGIAVDFTSYGSFNRVSKIGQSSGEFSAGDVAVSLGWASELGGGFSAGIAGKAIFSSIESLGSSALALDGGLLFVDTTRRLQIGLSVLNLGSQLSSYGQDKEDLPLDLKLGVSHELRGLPLLLAVNLHRLLDDVEGASFLDRFSSFSVGGEFRVSQPLRLRFGYNNRIRQDVPTGRSKGLSGLSGGLGVVLKDYRFDYALNSLSSLGLIHRVTIDVLF